MSETPRPQLPVSRLRPVVAALAVVGYGLMALAPHLTVTTALLVLLGYAAAALALWRWVLCPPSTELWRWQARMGYFIGVALVCAAIRELQDAALLPISALMVGSMVVPIAGCFVVAGWRPYERRAD